MKKTILVIDDDKSNLIIAQRLLSEEYKVAAINSGRLAFEYLSRHTPSAILLDIQMPEMDGFEVMERLRSDETWCKIPVIFLTARDTENDMITGFNIGADDYISKPFSIREVMLRVRAVLRRTKAVGQNEDCNEGISYQGLVLDLSKKTVNIDGENIPFTKTEFELLHTLLAERGRVFSRQELINRVWPSDVLVLDRTVDVNITRMRKKIGRFSKCIVTRQGFGYYFNA